MAGRRRIQRSVRVTVAAGLLAGSAALVAGCVASGSFVAVAIAAVLSVLVGAAAARIVYAEVLQSRRSTAHLVAEQARALQQRIDDAHREQMAFRERMSGRVLERDLAVSRLSTALQAAGREAADARSRAAEAAARARAETRRADETRRQLARLLDEVFGTALVDADDRGLTLLPSVRRPDPAASSALGASRPRQAS